jgi:hypothetical protein
MSDQIQREIEHHQHQVKSFQQDIDGAKQQIKLLKEHIAKHRGQGKLTPGEKSSMEIDRRRIEDWKDIIERRQSTITLEKESHKRVLAYLKKQK